MQIHHVIHNGVLFVLQLVMLTNGQSTRQKIKDLCSTLILDKHAKCTFDQHSLNVFEDNIRTLKYEILLPLQRRNYDILITTDNDLEFYYNEIIRISSNIKKIECKKKVAKKGVRKKIKKYVTTERPKEEKTVRESEEEEWDGWTYENLMLMKQYYEEMQQELEDIRQLL